MPEENVQAQVGRWAAAHAATLGVAGPAPADARSAEAVSVPAVLSSFTQVATIDTGFWTNAVAWNRHPDGRLLLAAAGGADDLVAGVDPPGPVAIWDYASGSRLIEIPPTGTSGQQAVTTGLTWGQGPGGEPLLAGMCSDGFARVWDAATGGLVVAIDVGTASASPGNPGAGGAMAWGCHPDGRWVLAAGASAQYGVRLWSAGTGEPEQMPGYAGDVSVLAWARKPDGDIVLAIGDTSGTIRLVHPSTGHPTQVLTGDGRDNVLSVCGRGDGTLLLAAGGGSSRGTRVIQVTDTRCTEMHSTSSETGVTGLAWGRTGDGRTLLAETLNGGARYNSVLRIYDGDSMRLLDTQELGCATGGYRPLDWTVTPDGRLLLAIGTQDKKVLLWEAVLDPPVQPPAPRTRPASRREMSQPAQLLDPPDDITPAFAAGDGGTDSPRAVAYRVRCAIGPDGHLLVAATSPDLPVAVWDANSGARLPALEGATANTGQLAWGRLDGGRLVLATAGSEGQQIQLWDPFTGVCLRRFPRDGPNDLITLGWVSANDGPMLVACYDHALRIYDPATGTAVRHLPGTRGIFSLDDGQLTDGRHCLTVSSPTNVAQIWDLERGELIRTLSTPGSRDGYGWGATWGAAADGHSEIAVGREDGGIECWDPETGVLLRTLSGHSRAAQTLCWVSGPGLPSVLISASKDKTVRIWDTRTWTQVAELPSTTDYARTMHHIVTPDGDLVLVFPGPSSDGTSYGPIRVLRIARRQPAGDGEATVRGGYRAEDAGNWLLRLGSGGLWPPAGLVTDLVTLTGQPSADTPPTEPVTDGQAAAEPVTEQPGPAEPLADGRLAVLAGEPGIARLRGLAAGEPGWNPASRTAFAALLTQSLAVPALYQPPAGTDPAELRAALATALTARPPGTPPAPWPVPLTDLRAAAAAVTDQVITLLTILGPAACAADPLLPLRLAHQLPQLPALSPRELRLLAALGPGQTTAAGATGTTWSPGTAGITRTGPLTRLLPTQLALPPDILAIRLAEDQLLYRQHRAPAPPAPEPVTIILDTTPATYGPAGHILRLAAHLLTLTLWHHGHHPALITLDQPRTPTELRTPADLLRIWTSRTLDNPAARLDTARVIATALGQPAVLCTHFHTARDHSIGPGPATRLLTTHQPPEKAPPRPASPWHAHLPPEPTDEQVTTAVRTLLAPATSRDGDRELAPGSG